MLKVPCYTHKLEGKIATFSYFMLFSLTDRDILRSDCPSLCPILQTYGVTKNDPSGNFLAIYWIQTQCILLLGEQVLTIFLCIKRVRLNWNFIVNDVQNATYSSHGAPCPARDLFPWLNTRVKVHISLWTIREYPKRHFRYLSDSGDTFLPLLSTGLLTSIGSITFSVCPMVNRGLLDIVN